jgi:putative ABC transport system substrate-binding protein
VPVIGFLSSVSAGASAGMALGFRRSLAETGYVEGQNIAVEYRWRKADMIGCRRWLPISSVAAVIAAGGTAAPALAARPATSTIPIVFQTGSDRVKNGLVPSLNRLI